MSSTIDFGEAAARIAQARREEVRQALDGIEFAPEEYALICDLAWKGGSRELISLIGKVREAERSKCADPAPAPDGATGFEFNPANEESKAAIVAAINRERGRIIRAGWPGLPVGWLPVRDAPSLHELVVEGRVELVTITAASKTVPGARAEYGYARIVKEAEPPRR
ncbi:hypothetical protein [Streptosporangium sp. NPDC002721]|uniref:hypothetical protein n=1 Tax=Streptosporangium sp. NPDC002721 TaxID=3366188 RepID=UPI0036B6FBAA